MAQNRVWGTNRRPRRDVDQLHRRPEVQRHRSASQAGSTFKAFTLAAALEKGIPLNDADQRHVSPKTFPRTSRTAAPARRTRRTPRATPPAPARSNMRQGGGATRSTPTSWRSRSRSALCAPAALADALGIRTRNGQADPDPGPVVHPGHQRASPLDDVRGLRHVRRPRRALHEPGDRLDHRPRAATRSRCPPKTASRRWTPRDRRRRQRACSAGVMTARLRPAATGDPMRLGAIAPRPARPAPPTTTLQSGSPATPRELAAAVCVTDQRSGFQHPLNNVTINGQHLSRGVRQEHPRTDLEVDLRPGVRRARRSRTSSHPTPRSSTASRSGCRT